MYRGFTYEFGESYSLQILDINDPDYKYINGRNLNNRGIETLGTSYCSREDASMFLEMWRNSEYNVNGRNCQDFAEQYFAIFLTGTDPQGCNNPPSKRKKRQASDLRAYINSVLIDCSNYETSSTADSLPTAVSLLTAAVLVLSML